MWIASLSVSWPIDKGTRLSYTPVTSHTCFGGKGEHKSWACPALCFCDKSDSSSLWTILRVRCCRHIQRHSSGGRHGVFGKKGQQSRETGKMPAVFAPIACNEHAQILLGHLKGSSMTAVSKFTHCLNSFCCSVTLQTQMETVVWAGSPWVCPWVWLKASLRVLTQLAREELCKRWQSCSAL